MCGLELAFEVSLEGRIDCERFGVERADAFFEGFGLGFATCCFLGEGFKNFLGEGFLSLLLPTEGDLSLDFLSIEAGFFLSTEADFLFGSDCITIGIGSSSS